MPVIGLTGEQIRVRVGRMLDAVKLITAKSNGSTTTFVTDDLFGDADDLNGSWWLGTDAPNDGVQARVYDSSESSNAITLNLHPAVTSTVSGDTAELWADWLNPVDVRAAINQAIDDATGAYYNDEPPDLSFHGGAVGRIDLSTSLDALRDVEYRVKVRSENLVTGGIVWDESVDSDFTVTEDTEDKLFGQAATKFVIGSGVSAGDLASDAITSADLSGYTHIEFPIKVRTAVAASDLVLRLSATANGADTDKIIAIPAISATTDTWVRVAMNEATSSFDASEATAIISVALEYNANNAANTVWLGTIQATDQEDTEWQVLSRHQWKVDRGARDLVFINGGKERVGYRLLKLVGGDTPIQIDADATVSEVPEDFLVYRAAAYLRGKAPESSTMLTAVQLMSLSNQAMGKWPMLNNMRKTI